jgi:hypothetical protein
MKNAFSTLAWEFIGNPNSRVGYRKSKKSQKSTPPNVQYTGTVIPSFFTRRIRENGGNYSFSPLLSN